MKRSLLSKSVIDGFVQAAQDNLQRDGHLEPMCFLRFTKDEVMGIPLSTLGPGDTAEERQQAMLRLRQQVSAAGAVVHEAVMLLETWYLEAKDTDPSCTVPPSEHRARQEAIVIVGRNTNQTRTTMVIQPFSRDEHKRLVWGEPPVAYYNQPPGGEHSFSGLLDFLFFAPGVN